MEFKSYSPGLIGGEKVIFLKANPTHFYIKKDGESSWQKDNSNQFIKISFKEVLEARKLFLTEYKDQELNELIEIELDSIKSEIKKDAEEINQRIKFYQDSLKLEDSTCENSIVNMLGAIDKKGAIYDAKKFFANNPDAVELKEKLQNYLDTDNYDMIDHILNFGKPMCTFSTNSESDMTALISMFNSTILDNTIDELQVKGSLYLKAKALILKEYPEYN